MSTPKHMRRDVPIEDAPRRAPEGVSDDSPAPLSHDAAPSVMAEEKSAQVGRSAALMSGLVIVSRLTGFFRTWGQAYAIGVTVMASCYSVANNLPNSLYELVVAGMLTTAFLPVYMSVKKRAGRAGADEYTSNLVPIILVVMGATAVLGFIFAAQLVWTQSFSASSDFDFDLTVWFFRFFVIEVVLYALSTIISGVLAPVGWWFLTRPETNDWFGMPGEREMAEFSAFSCSAFMTMMPPRGPRRLLCVVEVTTSA